MNDLLTGWFDPPAAPAPDTPPTSPQRLPNQPLAALSARQAALTEQYLLPTLDDLAACLLAIRLALDPVLSERQPTKQGKPYPLGQCLEITQAVEHALRRRLPGITLTGAAARGHAALSSFLRAGGRFEQVWGDLRDTFFQNAFQLGSLYVDVSNDTVTPTKPKIEILPFDQAGFVPITDYLHFARIAARYWGDRVYPNHILPELAPYCPLIHINRQGRVQLHEISRYMVALTVTGRFQPAEAVLRAPPMPASLFRHVVQSLAGTARGMASDPEAGRQAALQACRHYRDKRWHTQPRQTLRAVAGARDINDRLRQAEPLLAPPHYVPVSPSQHAHRRWRAGTGHLYTRRDAFVPLVAQELFAAAVTYPIAFIEQHGTWQPVALLRLDDAPHRYVDRDGRWLSRHQPAAYVGYPLQLVHTGPNRQALCVDDHSGLLSDTDGHPFFDPCGALAPATAAALQQLTGLHRHLRDTARTTVLLHTHGLLRPWPVATATPDLPPLYRFDDAPLGSLDPSAKGALQHSGALGIGYAQWLSMQHLDAPD